MYLKGQNFRILVNDNGTYKVVGMSTSCTVNLQTNTEDANTKDDVGLASKPTMTSLGWNVQVDSLNVLDAGAMLTAIQNFTPFTLLFDVVSSSDNQTPEVAGLYRVGQAYLADATFTFNDRENSSKSLQFQGTGPLSSHHSTPQYATVAAGTYTKGQFVRLFLAGDTDTASTEPSKVIAAAKQLTLHTSLTLEAKTTKDTTGNYDLQEPTGLSYDISTTALVRTSDSETITSTVLGQELNDIEAIYEAAKPVRWQIANVSGANQRTKGTIIASGQALVTSLAISAPNRQDATYTAQLTGYGAYTVGS
jgi:predicted secreted protein